MAPAKRSARNRLSSNSVIPRLPIEILATIAKCDRLLTKQMLFLSSQLYAILHVEQYREIELYSSTVAVCLSATLYERPELAARVKQISLISDWNELPGKTQTFGLELSSLVAVLKLCTQVRSLILSIPWLRLLGTSTYSRANPHADFGQFGEALGYMRQLRNFELTRAVEKGAEDNTVSLDVLYVLLDRSFPELEYLKFSAKRFHPLTFVPERQLVLKKFKFSQKFPHEGEILEMFGRMLTASIFEFSISATPVNFHYARIAKAFGRTAMDHLTIRSTSDMPLPSWVRPRDDMTAPQVDKLDLTFSSMQEGILTTLPTSVTNLGLRLETSGETHLFYELMVKLRDPNWMPLLRVLRVTAKSFSPGYIKSMSPTEKKKFGAAMAGCTSAAENRDINFQLFVNSQDNGKLPPGILPGK